MMKKPMHLEATVAKKLHPGSPGTLRHVRRWGDALVCVRHRHDKQAGMRYTTVEILVEEAPTQVHAQRYVFVRLDPLDADTRSLVLAAGGRWNRSTGLWRIPQQFAEAIGLAAEGVRPVVAK